MRLRNCPFYAATNWCPVHLISQQSLLPPPKNTRLLLHFQSLNRGFKLQFTILTSTSLSWGNRANQLSFPQALFSLVSILFLSQPETQILTSWNSAFSPSPTGCSGCIFHLLLVSVADFCLFVFFFKLSVKNVYIYWMIICRFTCSLFCNSTQKQWVKSVIVKMARDVYQLVACFPRM